MTDFHDRPNLKQWKALKLCELRKEFRNKEILHLYIEVYDNNWWFRISIPDGVSHNSIPINANIIYYQMKSKDNAIDDNFGPNEQPSLDVVEIKKLETLEESPISTTVVFEGSNVIEGVKKMVTSGYVIPPLPKFLVELHSSSKNYIEVVQQEN
ncbi:hypothetical protein C2G38_2052286 [Gigaspora rosea]|uniref:Uncharacterized protein n=1 Tax=Gigaspora rosea TaxID=44941 RepID=A0A397WBB7_9GLOM|nr:hypothetical protein C2G38_2052286 [Gigaspora rosea]